MEKITLTINDQELKATKGMTVLQAAEAAGVYIPTLCYFPDLEPYGGCRLCVVEIEKVRGLPAACTTPATDGMIVHTDSEAINNVRRTALELLLTNHPCDCLECHRRERCGPFDICLRHVAVTDRCVTCPANEQCELQKVVDYLGIHQVHLGWTAGAFSVDTSNPFFNIDRNRCILCARCVRACEEITGVGAIDLAYRGYSMKVATFGDKPLIQSSCASCGECVVRCPTGALSPKETRQPTQEVKTICPYCGVGCGILLGTRGADLISVRGDRENTVNNGRLCVKGRFGIVDFVSHSSRLRSPLIKKDGEFIEASWEEALDLVARQLDKYRGGLFAGISSAKCTNEENYVFQKFTRAVMGTNNIDHCARL